MLALLYLLCVMTPTIALALPGTATPDCLVMTDGTAIVHAHNRTSAEPQHHSMHGAQGAAHVHDIAVDDAAPAATTPAPHNHSSAGASCCELMCLTALPAMFAGVSPPDRPVSRCLNEASRVISGNAPPTLYRPPIS
jgi:hypothetical protein